MLFLKTDFFSLKTDFHNYLEPELRKQCSCSLQQGMLIESVLINYLLF